MSKVKLKRKKPSLWYVGSLVQQNFGESFDGHGYAICDLSGANIQKTLHDIPNDYGMYTLLIEDGIVPDNLPISNKTIVRIQTKNTNAAQLKKALSTLKKIYKISDFTIQSLDKNKSGDTNLAQNTLLNHDVRNVSHQNNLITEYLKKENIDQELLDSVLKINSRLNAQLNQNETVRNVIWKPKVFEFSNMFSYGENNKVSFDTLNGICGLFASNHAGKSAVLDALCFCLFDQSFRASKAEQVLNRKKDNFWCKFNFEINGLNYFIEKNATRYLKGPLAGKLRVDINFWYINHDGDVVSLNGEQRRDTDKIIQSYIGTFDDFILTALSLQGNNSNFIDKTQGERKDLLANFLDLKIFDTLYDLANKENRNAAVVLEEYQKQDFETKLAEAELELQSNEQKYNEADINVKILEDEIQNSNDELLNTTKLLQPCTAEGLDIDIIQNNIQQSKSKVANLTHSKVEYTKKLEECKNTLNNIKDNLTTVKNKFNNDLYQQYKLKVAQKADLDIKLETLKFTIKNKLLKLEKLNEHEYDPNCVYCVSNIFVKDAIQTKAELENDKETVRQFLDQLNAVNDFVATNMYIESESNKIQELQKEFGDRTNIHDNLQNQCERIQRDIDVEQDKINRYLGDVKLYNDNIAVLQNNKEINKSIEKQQQQIKNKKQESVRLHTIAKEYHSKTKVAEEVIRECNNKIQHMQELVEKQIAYDLYCKAVGKDGIPYLLISQAVPYIQQRVNNILNQVIDFTVELETDGKNINAFICYDSNKWPLELSSGMERFLSSLAIRLSLIDITNLPKPNFIAIDEGLGVLDSSNLNSMFTLFTYMKSMFKFSLIISHIDVVRDMVDTILTIDKQGEMSYINC